VSTIEPQGAADQNDGEYGVADIHEREELGMRPEKQFREYAEGACERREESRRHAPVHRQVCERLEHPHRVDAVEQEYQEHKVEDVRQEEQPGDPPQVAPELVPLRIDEGEENQGWEKELPDIIEARNQTLEEIGPFTKTALEEHAERAEQRADTGE